jgi:hypothetical protein
MSFLVVLMDTNSSSFPAILFLSSFVIYALFQVPQMFFILYFDISPIRVLRLCSAVHVLIMCQCHKNQSPEDGSRTSSRNVVCIKYTLDNRWCLHNVLLKDWAFSKQNHRLPGIMLFCTWDVSFSESSVYRVCLSPVVKDIANKTFKFCEELKCLRLVVKFSLSDIRLQKEWHLIRSGTHLTKLLPIRCIWR